MAGLRFKTIDKVGGFSKARLPDGSEIERQEGWCRLGGTYYAFTCSCGWTDRSSPFGSKTNHRANGHAEEHAARASKEGLTTFHIRRQQRRSSGNVQPPGQFYKNRGTYCGAPVTAYDVAFEMKAEPFGGRVPCGECKRTRDATRKRRA